MHVMAGFEYELDGKVMDRINLCKPGLLGKTHAKKFSWIRAGR